MTQLSYLDLDLKRLPTTPLKVFAAVGRMRALISAAAGQFYEREDVLHKFLLAFCLREHLLLIGPTGSAKSLLFNSVFDSITGAVRWTMDLTRFTGDTHLFGSYDKREMDKTGHLKHMTEGSLAEANFAHIGEFFDASDPTLRSLLGVLNECRVKRGPQLIKCPLLTSVADSNFRPEEMPARAGQLAAVVDRFLFKAEIDYVQDPRNDFEMHDASLNGRIGTPLPECSVDDIILVSGLIVGHDPNLLKNRYVLEAYVEMKRAASEARVAEGRPPISDRRSLKAVQLVEVSALLNGRLEATFDDLWEVQSVLESCLEDGPILQRTTKEAVKRWVAKEARHSIETELAELQIIVALIPTNVDFATLSSAEALALKVEVGEVVAKLDAYSSDILEVSTKARKSQEACAKLLVDADMCLLNIIGESLPKDPDKLPKQALAQASDELTAVEVLLKGIDPGSHEAIAKFSYVEQRIEICRNILANKLADREITDLIKMWYG